MEPDIDDDGRELTPLRMLRGNVEALLKGTLPVKGISFIPDPASPNGVILIVHGADHDAADVLGFKMRKLGK